jgi:hypothetical protein
MLTDPPLQLLLFNLIDGSTICIMFCRFYQSLDEFSPTKFPVDIEIDNPSRLRFKSLVIEEVGNFLSSVLNPVWMN